MRTIDRPSSFKRDYKREAKGQYRKTLDAVLLKEGETANTETGLESQVTPGFRV